MRSARLATALVLMSGCALVFDDPGPGGDDGGGDCVTPDPTPPPSVTLRNPNTLTCDTYYGEWPCLPDECGCSSSSLSTPPPPWGRCPSTCDHLTETECEQDSRCLVVRDAACAVSGSCTTDFFSCFPATQIFDPGIDCFTARDGESCWGGLACTAFHRINQGDRTFAMCAPSGKSPGICFGQVTCARPAPGCPPNARPGIDGGCYTGACIPVDVCEPMP